MRGGGSSPPLYAVLQLAALAKLGVERTYATYNMDGCAWGRRACDGAKGNNAVEQLALEKWDQTRIAR